MGPTDLITICLSAFVAVFILLSLLSLVMRLITTLFPDLRKRVDSATVAAITTSVREVIPGSQVTRVEEIR